jgi:hypothetical protein
MIQVGDMIKIIDSTSLLPVRGFLMINWQGVVEKVVITFKGKKLLYIKLNKETITQLPYRYLATCISEDVDYERIIIEADKVELIKGENIMEPIPALKTGMKVKLANGDICKVYKNVEFLIGTVDNILISESDVIDIDNYDEDLLFNSEDENADEDYNINIIYMPSNWDSLYTSIEDLTLYEPIWKRKENILEVTMDDVEAKFGQKVKIINRESS